MRPQTVQIIKFVLSMVLPKDPRNRGRHHKETMDHYIDVIGYVLKTGIQWHQLREKLHYTTYHKKFTKWSNLRVFETAFTIVSKLLQKQKYLERSSLQNLYIDSSMIKNVRGTKGSCGVNHFDRGRRGNKVTVVVTDKGVPLSACFDKSNVHDISMVPEALDNINVKILGSRLIADKGYISKALKHRLRRERQVYLVTPTKRNQKRKLPVNQVDLLTKRNIVENFFSWIQLNRRIRLRYKTKLQHYQQFYYLALIDVIHGKIET